MKSRGAEVKRPLGVKGRLPLEGVRVIELAVVWSGPMAGMLLADMGAEVIRVESTKFAQYSTRGVVARPSEVLIKTGGLITSGYPNREAGRRPWNRAPQFNCHARNKLSMTVDLTKPEGVEIFKKLTRVSNAVIENNACGVVERLGIGYNVLKQVNPSIIMMSMPSMGNTGPWRTHTLLGRHLEALSGHTLLRKYPDLDPSQVSDVYYCDAVAGAIAALGVMMALYHQRRTGRGQFIDMSQQEALLPQFGEFILDSWLNGKQEKALGNRHPRAAPCGCYRCKGEDAWVSITVFTDTEWRGLCQAMGNPPWCREARWQDQRVRYAHQDELDGLIEAWTREHTDYEVQRLCQKARVPAGVVMDERQCYTDPHLRQRGFFEEATQEDCGTHLYPGIMWKLNKTPGSIRLPPCRLGEHNEYVYKKLLGIPDEEYARLEKDGHIGMDFDESIKVRGKATG